MPIYEYRCSSCGEQQEVMQKINDPLLTTCAKCGKPTLVKMLTAAGFQLKGSGWYATDFKSKPAAAAPKETKEGGGEKKAADSGAESAKAPASTPATGTGTGTGTA